VSVRKGVSAAGWFYSRGFHTPSPAVPTSTPSRSPEPSREPDAARSLDTFRAVPPSFSQESVVARLRVDLATWVVDFLQCEPWEPVDELLLKLNGLAATAEVAIRELREVSGLDEDMGYSDRPGFPQ
jgi:hypothetical protein